MMRTTGLPGWRGQDRDIPLRDRAPRVRRSARRRAHRARSAARV